MELMVAVADQLQTQTILVDVQHAEEGVLHIMEHIHVAVQRAEENVLLITPLILVIVRPVEGNVPQLPQHMPVVVQPVEEDVLPGDVLDMMKQPVVMDYIVYHTIQHTIAIVLQLVEADVQLMPQHTLVIAQRVEEDVLHIIQLIRVDVQRVVEGVLHIMQHIPVDVQPAQRQELQEMVERMYRLLV